MAPPPSRRARIILVTPDGEVMGALPAAPVPVPWWQEVAPVVEAVRAAHGVDITVLRLLSVSEPDAEGVEVTYLAETDQTVAAAPWDGRLHDHPLRLAYARPGGPAGDLAWAKTALAGHGLTFDAPPIQVRSWNLSSLWRLSAGGRRVWLKHVPPFFAHEGAVIEALAGGPVPSLLGRDGARILMKEIPGQDFYDAREPALSPMIDLLVDLQKTWAGRTEELLALGAPDWRTPALIAMIAALFERHAQALEADDRHVLEAFVAGLPRRMAEVAACGQPDTLVHGDFHPGNLRGEAGRLTLLDWGDCGLGHPLLDQPAFLERIEPGDVASVAAHWRRAWAIAAPGSDPAKASALLAPVAAARQGALYQGFLDNIEPSEHPYHAADPLDRLHRTAELVRRERG